MKIRKHVWKVERGAHILAYTIPYPIVRLAVLEWATSPYHLVLLMIPYVGLLESAAEVNPNLDNCLLGGEVNMQEEEKPIIVVIRGYLSGSGCYLVGAKMLIRTSN